MMKFDARVALLVLYSLALASSFGLGLNPKGRHSTLATMRPKARGFEPLKMQATFSDAKKKKVIFILNIY